MFWASYASAHTTRRHGQVLPSGPRALDGTQVDTGGAWGAARECKSLARSEIDFGGTRAFEHVDGEGLPER